MRLYQGYKNKPYIILEEQDDVLSLTAMDKKLLKEGTK